MMVHISKRFKTPRKWRLYATFQVIQGYLHRKLCSTNLPMVLRCFLHLSISYGISYNRDFTPNMFLLIVLRKARGKPLEKCLARESLSLKDK